MLKNKTHVFSFLNKTIEFTDTMSDLQKLRLLSDPQYLNDYQRILFSTLFPSDLPIEEFDPLSTQPAPEVRLSKGQKEARWLLIHDFGFISVKHDIEKDFSESVPQLNVYFSTDDKTITHALNNYAEGIKRLDGIGQVDPRPRKISEIVPGRRVNKLTRLDHTKELTISLLRSVITMALITPTLFIRKVKDDMKNYSRFYGLDEDSLIFSHPNDHTKQVVENAIECIENEFIKDNLNTSLQLAYEYGKYLVLGAYLHDYFTPGWGDIVMKARKQFDGQTSLDYSEDATLADEIDEMVEDPSTFLPQIISMFSIKKDLLIAVIKAMASEGFPALPNDLMKDKRKYSDKVLAMWPHLISIKNEAAIDHDQRSGTQANAGELIASVMPGGYVILRKGQQEDPIGSFEERARLFMYALAMGISREELTEACSKLGVDPRRIYIAAQEIDFGPNIILREVELPWKNNEGKDVITKEILPVVTRPGEAKKNILMFIILTIEAYQSPLRSTKEKLLQDMILFLLNEKNNDSILNKKDFIYSSDHEVSRILKRRAPLLLWILNSLEEYATVQIMTKKEIALLQNKNMTLLQKANMSYLIDRKPGTFVQYEYENHTKVKKYQDVIRYKRSSNEVNRNSLPERLDRLQHLLKTTMLYHVIQLNDEGWKLLNANLNKNKEALSSLEKALKNWN